MKPIDIHPPDMKTISNLFYELEFAPQDKKNEILKGISAKIPWQYSIYDTIELLKDPILRALSRSYARRIQIERLYFTIKKLAIRPSSRNYEDLEEIAYLFSELGDPYTSYSSVKSYLDLLTSRVLELFEENRDILTDEVKVQLLIRVISEEQGLTGGNLSEYEDPNYSFITKVIQNKIGYPIALSIIYILVGRRLGLPVYGSNLPFHFLVYYDSPRYSIFIDPFNDGILLDRETCESFLQIYGFEPSKKYFTKCGTVSIIKRMIKNLSHIYQKNHSEDMVELMDIFLEVLEKKGSP